MTLSETVIVRSHPWTVATVADSFLLLCEGSVWQASCMCLLVPCKLRQTSVWHPWSQGSTIFLLQTGRGVNLMVHSGYCYTVGLQKVCFTRGHLLKNTSFDFMCLCVSIEWAFGCPQRLEEGTHEILWSCIVRVPKWILGTEPQTRSNTFS